jgi:hypothetical protein
MGRKLDMASLNGVSSVAFLLFGEKKIQLNWSIHMGDTNGLRLIFISQYEWKIVSIKLHSTHMEDTNATHLHKIDIFLALESTSIFHFMKHMMLASDIELIVVIYGR